MSRVSTRTLYPGSFTRRAPRDGGDGLGGITFPSTPNRGSKYSLMKFGQRDEPKTPARAFSRRAGERSWRNFPLELITPSSFDRGK